MDGEEHANKNITVERDALQAAVDAMRAERHTLNAELGRLRQECAAFHTEKQKLQAEIQALLAERDAVKMAAGVVGVVSTGSTNKRGRGGGQVRHRKPRSPKTPATSHVPQRQTRKRLAENQTDFDGQLSTQVTHTGQEGDPRETTSCEDGHMDSQAVPHACRKRKGVDSTLKSNDRVEPSQPKRQRLELKKTEIADDSDDNNDLAVPVTGEEDGLEDLHISFDGETVPFSPGFSSAAPQTDQLADVGVDADGDAAAVVTDEGSSDRPADGTKKKPTRKLYTCQECDKAFHWPSQYISHLKTHSEASNLQCPLCKKTFTRANILAVHLRKHDTPQRRHVCSHCAMTFPSNTSLRKHVHLTHSKTVMVKVKKGSKQFKCQQCGETFSKVADLNVHMGVHTDGKPFKCVDCRASFTTRGNLTVHMKKHRGEKPFQCKDCDATFPCHSDLKSHARRHATEKPYKCKFCSAAFCRAGDLKPHMRTHTGEKPFQCEVCGAAFSTSSNLAVHRRIHTGEKPFQCEQCGSSFSQLGHLTRHRSQHATERSFCCTVCPATFGNAYHLKVHMQRHNADNTFKCKCGAAFSRASILTEHMRIHTGEKPYRCNQCPAAFARSANLMAHRRKHTGERPYVCPHCKQGFTQSTSLNRHLQSQKACRARQALATPDLPPNTDGVNSDNLPRSGREGGEDEAALAPVESSKEGRTCEGEEEGLQEFFHREGTLQQDAAMTCVGERYLPASVLDVMVENPAPVSLEAQGFSSSTFTPTSAVPVCVNGESRELRTSVESNHSYTIGGKATSFESSESGVSLPSFNSRELTTTSSILQPCSAALHHGGVATAEYRLPCSTDGTGSIVITMGTEFEGGMSNSSSSLAGLASLSQSGSYLHSQMSATPPSHLPSAHAHLHHQ